MILFSSVIHNFTLSDVSVLDTWLGIQHFLAAHGEDLGNYFQIRTRHFHWNFRNWISCYVNPCYRYHIMTPYVIMYWITVPSWACLCWHFGWIHLIWIHLTIRPSTVCTHHWQTLHIVIVIIRSLDLLSLTFLIGVMHHILVVLDYSQSWIVHDKCQYF